MKFIIVFSIRNATSADTPALDMIYNPFGNRALRIGHPFQEKELYSDAETSKLALSRAWSPI